MAASRKRVHEGLEHGDFHEPGKIPSTRFNSKLGPHRVLDATRFDFDDIRQLKRAVPGATINDVVLAIIAGALRKYLDDAGELPEQSLVCGCPVDLREKDEQGADEGNKVGMMSVAVQTQIADPLERLQRVHEETQSSKAYLRAQGTQLALDFMDTVPAGVQSLLVHAASMTGMAEKNPMVNTMITNVPGAPCQLYMCGAAVVESFGIGLLSPGIGIFHTVNSSVADKQGVITLSFVSCRDVMPDPDRYKQCLNDSFAALQKACSGSKPRGKGKPGARAKARKKAKANL